MLVKSNCRAPFLGLPEGNCDFLKGITLFRYSPIGSKNNKFIANFCSSSIAYWLTAGVRNLTAAGNIDLTFPTAISRLIFFS